MATFWHIGCWVLPMHVSNVSTYLYLWLALPGSSLGCAHLLVVFFLGIYECCLDHGSKLLHGTCFRTFFCVTDVLILNLRLKVETFWYHCVHIYFVSVV